MRTTIEIVFTAQILETGDDGLLHEIGRVHHNCLENAQDYLRAISEILEGENWAEVYHDPEARLFTGYNENGETQRRLYSITRRMACSPR